MFEKSFLAFHFREMMEYDFNENEQSVYRLKKEERRGEKKELAHSNDFIRNERQQNGGENPWKAKEGGGKKRK